MMRGFSLVELSIVLVILGLLTGGILAGQSLIRASELRAITTEYDRYRTATLAFRDKYFGLPGDIINATLIWGKDTSYCNTQPGNAGSPGTCNGDSDGIIDDGSNEMYRFWQQLAYAGLIEGTYGGVADGTAYVHSPGVNAPISRIGGATWAAMTALNPFSGNSNLYDGVIPTAFYYGDRRTGLPTESVMGSAEMWNIDTKLDDGMPAHGILVPYSWTGWNNVGGTLNRCTLSTNSADIQKGYDLDASGLNCALIFKRIL